MVDVDVDVDDGVIDNSLLPLTQDLLIHWIE